VLDVCGEVVECGKTRELVGISQNPMMCASNKHTWDMREKACRRCDEATVKSASCISIGRISRARPRKTEEALPCTPPITHFVFFFCLSKVSIFLVLV
jgi:hypothetical protein